MPARSTLLVFLAAFALYAATAHRRVFTAGNDAARWATIESIVDRGTTSIEGSRFAGTVDQARLGDRVYSNKPPLLAFAGAAVYAPLERVTGWTLGGRGAANVLHVVVVLLVGLPAALLAAGFHRELRREEEVAGNTAAILTVGLAAGTLLWPFATTLNAHVPAAVALFFAFVDARRGRALRSGMLCGLAAALDLLPGLGFAPFLGAIAWRQEKTGKGGWHFAIGLFALALLASLANLFHHGSPLPIKMVPGAIDLAAKAGPSVLGVVLPERASYPLELLFGWHGLFTVSPILLFGVAGLWLACRREAPERTTWRLVAVGITLQFAAHAVLAGSYGGWSYGYRYLVPVQPLLLLTAHFAFRKPKAWLAPAFAGALAVSVLFAALGAYHPWPPAYEQESHRHAVASLVTNPVGGNAAAWLTAHDAPGAGWATRRFVSDDPEKARAYFALFFGSKGDFENLRKIRR